jgi:hypothetical protein
MKGISFLSALSCGVLLSACGSDSQSENTGSNSYSLLVNASQIEEAITLKWLDSEYTINPQSETTFTQSLNEFIAPSIIAMPNYFACEMDVEPIAEFSYQATIECERVNNITLDTSDDLAYPVTVQYGAQTHIISQQGEVSFSADDEEAPQLLIESTGGPQTCDMMGGNGLYSLTCEPFILSYGYFAGHRNLYKISDSNTAALFEFGQPDDVLVYEDYFYLNDKMWFRGQQPEDNQVSIYSASIDNGKLEAPEKTISAATSLSHLNNTAYALVENEIGEGGYKVQYMHEGEWKTARDHSNYFLLSEFINAGDHLQWYFRPTVDDGTIWLGRIFKTEIEGGNDIVWAKQLSAAFTKVSQNPMFKYDGYNYAAGFDDSSNTIIDFTFSASQDRQIETLEDVNTFTVWAGSDENQYLFYTKDNTVQQLSYAINDVAGSQAFDMATLQASSPTWVGGDLTQLAAGQMVSGEYGVLNYLRVGDEELSSNDIFELFEARSEVRVLFSKRRHGSVQISTPVISKQGHLLVYVGQDDVGELWIIDGLTPYKVADNVSWDKFMLGYSIENVSAQHASVLDSELRIHEVYKQ